MKELLTSLKENPSDTLFMLIIGTILVVFLSERYATINYVNAKVNDVQTYVDSRHLDVKETLNEIKADLKVIRSNILILTKDKK